MRRLRVVISVLMLAAVLLAGTVPTTSASPAAQGGIRTVTHDQTGKLTFIGIDSAGGRLPKATGIRPSDSAGLNDLAAYSQEFGISDPARELQFVKSATTRSGSTSYRYQQVYQGVPILAGELIANYNSRGNLMAITGEISPNLSLDVTPQVSTTTAKERALAYVARRGYDPANLEATEPELWIYDARLLQRSNLAPALVWRLEVKSIDLLPIRYLVLVDAKLGSVRLAFNQIDTYIGEVAAERYGLNAGASDAGSSARLFPNYPDPLGTTWDSHSTSDRNGEDDSTVVCNTPPTALTDAGSCDGTGAPASTANAAHYFAYDTFNYYDSHHNRNSIDDGGHPLNSNVNYRPGAQPYMNAFWDGSVMTYGDGDFFTADDVVAHELSHGVTEYSSGLLYFNESGAINETMSDVFGEFVDQANGTNSFGTGPDEAADMWLMGEDLGIGAIRDMSDPTVFGDPDRVRSPNYWTSGLDNGGVHINMGVGSKTAYLMAAGDTFNGQTITALGNDKTSAIFYEVNHTLLTSGADFQQFGAAIVQACNSLVGGPLGITAADCTEAYEATLATELHLEPVDDTTWTPQADVCPTTGDTPTALFFQDFEGDTGLTLTGFEDGIIDDGNANMPVDEAWVEASFAGASNIYPPVTGDRTAFGVNHPYLYGYYPYDPYESYLQMSSYVTLPSIGKSYLYFDHYFAFEIWRDDSGNDWEPDGGQLLYQIEGSGTWTDAGSLFDDGQDYNGVVDAHDNSSPLEGQEAFIVNSHGYVSTRYDLSSLAGQSVRFRWYIGADSYGDLGWYLDNVQIYNCAVANLSITKTDDVVGTAHELDTITYTLTVTNNGPDDAANVIVSDTFGGAAVTVNSVTPSQGSCTAFPCNLGTIANGANATITVVVTADEDGTITNHAEVVSDAADFTPANNAVDETTVVEPTANMSVFDQSDDAVLVSVGETFTYTIGYTNFGGPSDAHNVVIDNVFSGAAVTINRVWASHSDCTAFPCTIDGAVSPWRGGNIWVEITANAPGTITSNVSIDADEYDNNLTFNTYVKTTTVADAPRLIAPANGSVTKDNSPTFEWNADLVPWAASYEIEIDDNDDFSSIEQTTITTDLFFTADTLLDNTTYYWHVRGRDGSDVPREWSPAWSVHIDTVRLDPPVLKQPKDRTNTADTTPRFTWNSVKGAAGYWLQIFDDGDLEDRDLVVNDQTLVKSTYTVPDALGYGVYYWRVAARDAAGNWSDWSQVYAFTLTIQTSPKNGDYSVKNPPTFQWKKVANATRYEFQLEGPILDNQILTTTKYTPAAALTEGLYTWRVRAEVGGDWTNWMPAWVLTVTAQPPSAPGLTAPADKLATANNTQLFKWDAVPDAGGPFTYQIQIDNNANFSSPEQDYQNAAGDTDYGADALADGKYYWRVRAVNAVGVAGKWSKRWSFTIDTTGPAAPGLVTPAVFADTGDQPEFSWKKVKGAATYHLVISPNLDLSNPTVEEHNLTGTVYTPAAGILADGTFYFWAVSSVDALANEGPASDTWSFTVNSALNPPDIPELTGPANGGVITTPTADLDWNPVTDAAQYQYQVDDKADFKTPVEDGYDASDGHQTQALNDGKYYWRARAINADLVAGAWSAPWSFTIDTTGPAAPKLKAPKTGSFSPDTTPTFTWTVPKTAVGYHLQVDDNDDFSSTVIDDNTLIVPTYTAATLPYGVYYWQVRAQDAYGNWGPWSLSGSFEITLHKAPKNGTITTSTQPTFTWNADATALTYCLHIENGVTPIDEVGLTVLSYTPAAALLPGDHPWHVGFDNTGDNVCDIWMTDWQLHTKVGTPKKVKLESPKNRFLTNDTTPTLTWAPADGAAWYDLQISTDKKFASLFDSQHLDATLGTHYTMLDMPDGGYFWRVRALNAEMTAGPWSTGWSFTVDTTPPDAPDLIGPADETRMTNRKFQLEWSKVPDAARYELQIDADPGFPTAPIDVGKKTKYKAPSWLSQATYNWRVRAIDKAGNTSDWSEVRVFYLVAGDTSAPIITIQPVEPIAPIEPATPTEPTDPVEPTEPDDIIVIPPDEPAPSDPSAPPQEPDAEVPPPADPPEVPAP